ncbi:uncharacterized protein PV09_04181 [Verruconis gallopava]|uniref:Uncharacterized protein n=1 Tax=Verruconis gallopava TaxID=253628 RepID=A0A0D1XQV9_9PEZI|nr:uncharacterized protein PV09_04181 [Verruconis gallopava]KIW05026.1 hypothetical protein PV09_04181 [Verruconis gallopava]
MVLACFERRKPFVPNKLVHASSLCWQHAASLSFAGEGNRPGSETPSFLCFNTPFPSNFFHSEMPCSVAFWPFHPLSGDPKLHDILKRVSLALLAPGKSELDLHEWTAENNVNHAMMITAIRRTNELT